MFIVFLRFSNDQAKASELMARHNEWVARGLQEGAFLLVGSLQPRAGGAILAHGLTRTELEAKVNQDPFVSHGVVSAELFEVSASQADPRLAFLVGSSSQS